MSTRAKNEALQGVFCLPTSTKFHMQELDRSVGYRPNQFIYLLEAVDSIEDGGYPAQVILTSSDDLDWDVDDVVKMQHAEVRKALPDRRVIGMILPNGEQDGLLTAEGVGLPHWECIKSRDDGKGPEPGEIRTTKLRILDRRNMMEAQKQAARDSKRPPKRD